MARRAQKIRIPDHSDRDTRRSLHPAKPIENRAAASAPAVAVEIGPAQAQNRMIRFPTRPAQDADLSAVPKTHRLGQKHAPAIERSGIGRSEEQPVNPGASPTSPEELMLPIGPGTRCRRPRSAIHGKSYGVVAR
jgi:hypothetical protein